MARDRRAESRAYYLKNREAILARTREYYLKNQDRYRELRRSDRAGRNEYHRKRRERFKDAMARLKDAPCADCGGRFHHAAMQWDHVRGRKLFIVSEAIGRKPDAVIRAELEKCDLVCANCHAVRTYERAQQGRAMDRVKPPPIEQRALFA